MSISITRRSRTGRTGAQRMLLLGAVVIAIVAGLLAMHTFTGTAGNHDDSIGMTMDVADSVATTMGQGVIAAHGQVAGVATHAVAGPFTPERLMGMMACILALLTGLLLLLVAASEFATGHSRFQNTGAANIRARALVNISPRPPDLQLLSISRV